MADSTSDARAGLSGAAEGHGQEQTTDAPQASSAAVPAAGETSTPAAAAASDTSGSVPSVGPLFEDLSEEERARRIEEATHAKNEGNKHFSKGEYVEGVAEYTRAIKLAPFHDSAAVFYANRAACHAKLNEHQQCIDDCTKALELKPDYTKALLRRAQAREANDALEAALDDYKLVLQQDPHNALALDACKRLPSRIEEQREKLKTEMFDKLRDLGNMVLRPFGLSTNNFNMVKDPTTGSYSVQFNK